MPEELSNIRPQLEELVHNELSSNEEFISCVIDDVKNSESLDLLALNVQRFSSTYSFVLNGIVRKAFRRWPYTRFLGRDAMNLFVSEMSERFFAPFIRKALGFAKSLGKKFNAESISITIGTPFIIRFTITLKIGS